MKDLKALHIMARPAVSAIRTATAIDIAVQLLSGPYSGMPVTDEQGQLVGVVTELDLLKAAEDGRDLANTVAEEIMSTRVVAAEVNTPVSELMRILTDNNIIRLPITDNGKLVGVVARCDVLGTLIDPEFVNSRAASLVRANP